MSLEFSVGLGRDETLPEIAEEARAAEESGFTQFTLVDQQNLSRDVYIMMAEAARATNRIKIGHGVTIPATRHPSVTANATASVNELANGRVFLGIGAGGNALRSMGQKARPVQELRETIEFIKKYMRGEEAEFHGSTMHSEWIRQPVPIVMAATQPVSCRLAGEVADAVMLAGSVHPEVVKWRMEFIEQGALKAGRDPSEIEVWVRNMTVIADSREAARREASAYGVRGVWLLLGSKRPEAAELRRRLEPLVPDLDGLIAEGKRVYDAYDEYQHEVLDSPHSQLATQRMVDFLHLTGTPDDICERIEQLREIGVKNISCTLFTAQDRVGMMREIGNSIISRFQA